MELKSATNNKIITTTTPDKQLESAKESITNSKREESNNENTIAGLLKMLSPLLLNYAETQNDIIKHQINSDTELTKENNKLIEKLDTKEKIYKGVMILICISALLVTAFYIPKSETIIPVLTLIIGLLFKNNSLSDFFSHKKKNTHFEDE